MHLPAVTREGRTSGMVTEERPEANAPTVTDVRCAAESPDLRAPWAGTQTRDMDHRREDHQESYGLSVILLDLDAVPLAYAAELRPKDQVRLVERERPIPAYPTPAIRVCLCAWSAAHRPRSCTSMPPTAGSRCRASPSRAPSAPAGSRPVSSSVTPGRGDPTADPWPGVLPKAPL